MKADVHEVSVRLIRPSTLAAVAPGATIQAIGWIECADQDLAVDLALVPDVARAVSLGTARVGLVGTDITALTGHVPTGAGTGFVFNVVVPHVPAGRAMLAVVVRGAGGVFGQEWPLTILGSTGSPPLIDAAAQANDDSTSRIRALIEKAEIDEYGIIRVAGWAACHDILDTVDAYVGSNHIGTAQHRLKREDVSALLPEYASAGFSGFELVQELSDEDLLETDLIIVAASREGTARRFSVTLARPARLNRLPRETIANLTCEEVSLTADGHLAVKGWAVASSGVAEIRIDLDDTFVGSVIPGESRPDVGNSYPCVPGARQSGFRFERRLEGAFEGEHLIRLSVLGTAGEENACFQPVAAIAAHTPVSDVVTPDADAIKFYLDAPACKDGFAIEASRGFLSLSGWAIGRDGISHIEVFVDGVSQGMAHHGIRREDLQAAFPEYDALRAGFAMMLPPNVMKKGVRALRVDICDKVGRVKEISFSVRAEAAATGPGPWLIRTKLPQSEVELLQAILRSGNTTRSTTILVCLDDATPHTLEALSATIESLRWQACEEWSLIVTVARADDVALVQALIDASHSDLSAKIGLMAPQPTRSLAEITDGVLIVLSAGDRLGEDAIAEYGIEAALEPSTDFLYSDERRIDPADGEVKAFFKPDFSPDLLLATNYVGRAWCANAALLGKVGITEADLRRHGGYDAVLRLTERAVRIGHVAKVLCARGPYAEPPRRERAALVRAQRRRQIRGTVSPGVVPGSWRMQRDIDPRVLAGGMVSIIIPTIAAGGLIRTAIESIRANTSWRSYEIVCLDNIAPGGTAEQQAWKNWIAANADRTLEIAERFNWARFNNLGAKVAQGAFLLFLNDDVEIRDPLWLHGLVEQAQRAEVGVVGPQLLYPDGRVQHAGMFLARSAGRHAFRFYPADEPGPFGLALTQREVISVTGACMMMRRAVFEAIDGFDEAHAVVNNDLDFNLRARRSGLSVVYTPTVSLIHHEMVSRAELADTYDPQRFADSWAELFQKGDPFFSRHFSTDCDDYLPNAEPVRQFTAGRPLIARERVRRILAVKVDHIGDFITAFPAFRRIKERFPGAELTVVVAKASLVLASLEPAIDRIVEFNFFHARSEEGQRAQADEDLAALRVRLAPDRYDLALDLRRQPDTRSILRSTGARWLAGFDSQYTYPWLDIAVEFEGDLALHHKRDHVTDSLVALVDAVSHQCDSDRRIVQHPMEHGEARRALAAIVLPRVSPASRKRRGDIVSAFSAADIIVCVHTGAGAVNKQWPVASFAGLVNLLLANPYVRIVLVGGPEEVGAAAQLAQLVTRPDRVIDLVGKTGLRDLPAILRGADLYIGNDSGPKHLAAALGVATIGIHSGSVDAGEWGPVGPRAMTIRREMTCSPCYLALAADCHRGLACLEGIRVSDVFEACRRMLAIAMTDGVPARSAETPESADAIRAPDPKVAWRDLGVRVGTAA